GVFQPGGQAVGPGQGGHHGQSGVANGRDGGRARLSVRSLDRAARLGRGLARRHDRQGHVLQAGLEFGQGRAGQQDRAAARRDALGHAVLAQLDGGDSGGGGGQARAAGGQNPALRVYDHEGGFGRQAARMIKGGGGLSGRLVQGPRARAQGQGGAVGLGLDLRGGKARFKAQRFDAGGFGLAAGPVGFAQDQQGVSHKRNG